MKKKEKINDNKLLQLVNDGLTQVKIAEHFGVTPAAVNKRLKTLRGRTTRTIVTKKVEDVVDRKIDAMTQLARINDHANWLLEHVMKWIQGDQEAIQVLEAAARQVNRGTKEEPEFVTEFRFTDPHKIALAAMAEIRSQLDLQLKMFQTMYDMQAASEFQDTVLEVIAEIDPEVRNEIIRRLNERRSVRSALRFT